jgi:hypothetical protein
MTSCRGALSHTIHTKFCIRSSNVNAHQVGHICSRISQACCRFKLLAFRPESLWLETSRIKIWISPLKFKKLRNLWMFWIASFCHLSDAIKLRLSSSSSSSLSHSLGETWRFRSTSSLVWKVDCYLQSCQTTRHRDGQRPYWRHKPHLYVFIHSFINGSTALCWALASSSVS